MRRTSQNLTETLIKKTPAPKTGRTYLHDDTPGLTLQITANGVKSFQLYGRINGKVKRITLGRWVEKAAVLEPTDLSVATVVDYCKSLPILKLAMARKVCGLMRSHLSGQGAKTPAQVKRQQNQELTFGEMLDAFEDAQKKLNTKQWIQSARKHLTEFLSMKPYEIDPEAAEDWHRELCRSKSGYVANRALQAARAAIRRFKGERRPTPFDTIKLAKEKPRTRFLTRPELQKFYEALNSQPSHWADYFRLLLLTGRRKEEVLTMRWQDINLEEATWLIPGELQKSGEPYLVSLAPPVTAVLSRRWESQQSKWVFPGTKKDQHLSDPKWAWAEIKEHMGVDDLRIHDLRRTSGSVLAQLGVPMAHIQDFLGHASVRTTQQSYAHLSQTERRETAEKVASIFEKAKKG